MSAGAARLSAAVALLFAACAGGPPRVSAPATASSFVDMMIERLGPPDRVEGGRFVWDRRGVWLKIAVRDDLAPAGSPEPSGDIEETISYRVPAGRRAALAAFGRGLAASDDGQELSARSTGEERNFLLLNLGDEIVGGRLSPEDARVAYLRALTLDAAGKSTPAMSRLLFR